MVKHHRHGETGECVHAVVKGRDIAKDLQVPAMIGDPSGQPCEAVDPRIAAEQHVDAAADGALFAAGRQHIRRRVLVNHDDGFHRRVGNASLQRRPVVGAIDARLDDDRAGQPQCPLQVAKGRKGRRRGRIAALGNLRRRAVKDMEMAVAGAGRNIECRGARIRVRRGAERRCAGHVPPSSQAMISAVSSPSRGAGLPGACDAAPAMRKGRVGVATPLAGSVWMNRRWRT